jgi:hypothetical protein
MNYDNLLDEMCYGSNHMIIHGPGGSGKSSLIHKMQKVTTTVIYTAPTGIAALNINGMTIHSLFYLLPSIQNPFDIGFPINDNNKLNMLINADTLLIDEISMLRRDAFDKVNTILKFIRKCREPFGGMRLIMVCDLFQLCPVTKNDASCLLEKLYPDNSGFYFFNSTAFNELLLSNKLRWYELTHNFRQESDIPFMRVLNEVRVGEASDDAIQALNTRIIKKRPRNTICLARLNETVKNFNKKCFSKLTDTPYYSKAFIYPIAAKNSGAVRQCPYSKTVPIIKGMAVRFNMNDGPKNNYRFVNGTMGVIIDKVFSNEKLQYVVADINGEKHAILRETRTLYQDSFNKETSKIESIKHASITQFPFEPGFASTIHKSQGMTLDRAIIDIGDGDYPHGLLYVALSRVRRLEDLYLVRPVMKERIKVSKNVNNFLRMMYPMFSFVDHEPVNNGFTADNNAVFSPLLITAYGEKAYLPFSDPSIVEYGPYSKLDEYGFPIS